MKYMISYLALAMISLTTLPVRASAQESERLAPLLEGIGRYSYPISTDSAQAQRYFDQGLMLSYGFNHAEAERSFREAVRLDPDCAMCYWGAALVLGPNINAPMKAEAVPRAYEAISKALELAPKATEKERALINALARRYAASPPENRFPLDQAYAGAMREVAHRFPDDVDVATLFAEALMDLHPWNYWTKKGTPHTWTPEVVTTLESVLQRAPGHQGAIHFYIHIVEASSEPQRAERYADRLNSTTPGTSHLAHMPSHIYLRVGRYHDASLANERALQVDQAYITECHSQGIYPLGYMPHNSHFLWYTAMMEGRSDLSMMAARKTAAQVDKNMMHEPFLGPLMQHFSLVPLYGLVRFGQWDAILQVPRPAQHLLYSAGVWHYARGMAFVGKGQLEGARNELQKLKTIAATPSLDQQRVWDINTTASLLQIASEVLFGKLAQKQGEYERAIEHFRKAVDLQDALIYNEPPDWYYPVRLSLGSALLEANRPAEAESVYREDLRRNPKSGWSLFGLTQSLLGQDKTAEAAQAQEEFEKAWLWADVKLTIDDLWRLLQVPREAKTDPQNAN